MIQVWESTGQHTRSLDVLLSLVSVWGCLEQSYGEQARVHHSKLLSSSGLDLLGSTDCSWSALQVVLDQVLSLALVLSDCFLSCE